MCGRFVLDATTDDLIREFLASENTFPGWVPRWNIAPTTFIPIITEPSPSQRIIVRARWSLVPPWSKELTLPYSTFNARSESASTKASFSGPLCASRCLIPATGYYEWAARDGAKAPHFIHRTDRSLFAMAGLMTWWSGPDSTTPQATATILTRDSAGAVASLHSRMPVMVTAKDWSSWLDPGNRDGKALLAHLSESTHHQAGVWTYYRVAPLAGEGAALIESAEGAQ